VSIRTEDASVRTAYAHVCIRPPWSDAEHARRNLGDPEHGIAVGDLSQVVEGRMVQAEVVAGRLVRDVVAAAPTRGGQVGRQHRRTFLHWQLLQPYWVSAAAMQHRVTV
jgi:hypothetical protein